MVAWPDFRHRLRRFLVIGLGMALVLSVTLLLSAFSEGFKLRSDRLLDVFGGDSYVVASGSSGPFTSSTPLDLSVRDAVDAAGATARPLFMIPNAVMVDGQPNGVVVVGSTGDEPGLTITAGRAVDGPFEAVADVEISAMTLGTEFLLAGQAFTVVGQTEHVNWDIATNGLIIQRQTALDLFADGRDVATAFVVDGQLSRNALPAGTEQQGRDQAFDDVLNRTTDAKRSIDSFKLTLWLLGIVIVASVLYLSALERVGDFAIFKATGASNIDLVAGLVVQAAMVGAIAGFLSIGLAHLMKPVYPGLLHLNTAVAWPVVPIAIVIAAVSSVVGIRRAIAVDPSQAFG